jgi:hypothetical protein
VGSKQVRLEFWLPLSPGTRAVHEFESLQSGLKFTDFERLECCASRCDQNAQSADPVIQTEPVSDDNIQDAADAFDTVERHQVVDHTDGALATSPHAAEPPRLGRILRAVWVMQGRQRSFPQRRSTT